MDYEIKSLSMKEIREYEALAHQLRGEAIAAGSKALVNWLKSLPHRISHAFHGNAHA